MSDGSLSTNFVLEKKSTSTFDSGIKSKSEGAGVYCFMKGFQLVLDETDFDGEDPWFAMAGL